MDDSPPSPMAHLDSQDISSPSPPRHLDTQYHSCSSLGLDFIHPDISPETSHLDVSPLPKNRTATKPPRHGPAQTLNSSCTVSMILDDPAVLLDPWCVPQELVESCRSGDVLLVCNDGKAVQCHSQILALCSSVMRDMLDSIDFAGPCVSKAPIRITMVGDQAEHWLFALSFMYPNVTSLPRITLANAMILGELGHKYDIPKAMAGWNHFVDRLFYLDADVGHHRWVVRDWGLKRDDKSFCSDTFVAAGHKWRLKLYPNGCGKAANGSYLSLYLFSRGDTTEDVNVDFHLILVRRNSPSDSCICSLSHIFTSESRSCGEHKFLALEQFESPEHGFVTQDTVEIRAIVSIPNVADDEAELLDAYRLSCVPEDAGYVFKWWEVAQKLKDDRLSRMCLTYLGHNAFYALLNPQFKLDLMGCLTHLDIEDRFRLLLDMRDFL